MSGYHNNSIFWVEVQKIDANPYQPRKEFDPKSLEDLADSIRQYGVLQPLVVTRKEIVRPDNNGIDVQYELIAGERRLRASRIAGLQQVPVIIRKETDGKVKLELAIIENLQREDLNPIDRALAFEQLYKQFGLTHVEIGKKMGKSRVYVSNSLRLLSLPEEIKRGLTGGRISEGHTRPLLMLVDRPEEQNTLYKEIMIKKLSVRDAERVARKIAQDRVRKKEFIVDPKIREFERKLSENLGTRVHIEPKEKGGQITIDYFTTRDLESILASMKKIEREENMMESYLQNNPDIEKQIQKTTHFAFKEEKITKEPKPTFDFLEYTPDVKNEIQVHQEPVAITESQTSDILETKPHVETSVFQEEGLIQKNEPEEKENFSIKSSQAPVDYDTEPFISEKENIIIDTEKTLQGEVQEAPSVEQYVSPAALYQAKILEQKKTQDSSNQNNTVTNQGYDEHAYNQPPVMPKKKSFFSKLFG